MVYYFEMSIINPIMLPGPSEVEKHTPAFASGNALAQVRWRPVPVAGSAARSWLRGDRGTMSPGCPVAP